MIQNKFKKNCFKILTYLQLDVQEIVTGLIP